MKKIVFVLLVFLITARVFSQPGLTVVAPNGGENWITGCPYAIQWIASNTTGTVKIELFTNDIFSLTICSQVPAGMNSFTWVPPSSLLPGNNFRVKVTSLTSAAAFDFSDNNFAISPGIIQVTSPNGGETWVKGTMHPILWSDNLCDNVRIELWKGGLFNSVIATSIPSNGTFNWNVPNVSAMVPGNDYKVKVMRVPPSGVTSSLAYDFSDNTFTISAGTNITPITVVTPNGGENWITGCPVPVQWITATPTSPVKIELYKNDLFCMTICPQVPAGQSIFTWVPPYNVVPANNYKVKVTSLLNTAVFDFSNANFSVGAGSITVGSPNGGETWVKGTMHPILWTDNLCDNVRIELWKGSAFNSVIATSVPSTGTFNWTVPNISTLLPGNDYKVKIMRVPPAGNTSVMAFDFSDNVFTIAAGVNISPITVITPNGGENWIIGCPVPVQWITATPTSPVKIELYKNDLFSMTICPQVPAGQNMFTWVPPYNVVPGNNYKVKVTSLANPAIFDLSNAIFSINPGSIAVVSPNGGETWVKGTMHPILWSDNLCDNVRIELWKGSAFNSVIATSVPSNGTFNWMIPNIAALQPGSDYRVKIMSLPPAGISSYTVADFSNANFAIMGSSPVPFGGQNVNVTVYPNPFCNQLHVGFRDGLDEPALIEIVNLNGDLMLSSPAAALSPGKTADLNTSALPAGKYLLLLKKENRIVSQHHIVLVR